MYKGRSYVEDRLSTIILEFDDIDVAFNVWRAEFQEWDLRILLEIWDDVNSVMNV